MRVKSSAASYGQGMNTQDLTAVLVDAPNPKRTEALLPNLRFQIESPFLAACGPESGFPRGSPVVRSSVIDAADDSRRPMLAMVIRAAHGNTKEPDRGILDGKRGKFGTIRTVHKLLIGGHLKR